MVQSVKTVAEVDPTCKYHYEPPFLIVSSVVEDIGLVGWNNKRWTHQDKTRREPAPRPHASGWMQAFDPHSRMYYFYNESLSITAWEEPDEQFEADATVDYYVKMGLAPPWTRSNDQSSSKKISGSVLHPRGQVVSSEPVPEPSCSIPESTAGHQTQPETDADVPFAASESPLVPASVKFSPKKKGDLQPSVERYWILRYSLFSRWSSGVCLNETSLFSVTPEVISKHHACILNGGGSVLDAFCGCGGNTIAFGHRFDKVCSAPHSIYQCQLHSLVHSYPC